MSDRYASNLPSKGWIESLPSNGKGAVVVNLKSQGDPQLQAVWREACKAKAPRWADLATKYATASAVGQRLRDQIARPIAAALIKDGTTFYYRKKNGSKHLFYALSKEDAIAATRLELKNVVKRTKEAKIKEAKEANGEIVSGRSPCCVAECATRARVQGLVKKEVPVQCNIHIEEQAIEMNKAFKLQHPNHPKDPDRVYRAMNPLYKERGAAFPYEYDEVITLDFRGQRAVGVHPAFILKRNEDGSYDPEHIELLVAKQADEWAEQRERMRRLNANGAATATKPGQSLPLTNKELAQCISDGVEAIKYASAVKFGEEEEDGTFVETAESHLICSNKVPLDGDLHKDTSNESTRKIYKARCAVLVGRDGRVPTRKVVPNHKVSTLDEFKTKLDELEDEDGASTLTYFTSRATDQDSAWESERGHQSFMNREHVPNFTEAPVWHQGNWSSKDYSNATITVFKDALFLVYHGHLFFNLDMPDFLRQRIKKNYPWARDMKYWRAEVTDAKKRTSDWAAAHREEKRTAAASKSNAVKPSASATKKPAASAQHTEPLSAPVSNTKPTPASKPNAATNDQVPSATKQSAGPKPGMKPGVASKPGAASKPSTEPTSADTPGTPGTKHATPSIASSNTIKPIASVASNAQSPGPKPGMKPGVASKPGAASKPSAELTSADTPGTPSTKHATSSTIKPIANVASNAQSPSDTKKRPLSNAQSPNATAPKPKKKKQMSLKVLFGAKK